MATTIRTLQDVLDFITAYFQTADTNDGLSHQWLPEFSEFWANQMPNVAMSPEGWATVMNHLVERVDAHLAYIESLEPEDEHGYYWVWVDNVSDVQAFRKEAMSIRDTATRFADALSAS